MNSREAWGFGIPMAIAGTIVGVAALLNPPQPVFRSVSFGTLLALLQSLATTAALKWAWRKPFFYWVWGAGIFGRALVFAATFFFVYKYSRLNLAVTMITMVTATTFFLVVESLVLFPIKQHGLS